MLTLFPQPPAEPLPTHRLRVPDEGQQPVLGRLAGGHLLQLLDRLGGFSPQAPPVGPPVPDGGGSGMACWELVRWPLLPCGGNGDGVG